MPKHARTEKTDSHKPEQRNQEFKTKAPGAPIKDAGSTDAPDAVQDYPDALDSLVPDVDTGPLCYDSSEEQLEMARADAWNSEGKKAKKPKKHLTVYQKKSRRMRRVLIVVILLLIALIGALGYFTYLLFDEAQNEAAQQTLQQAPHDVDALKEEETKDASTTTTKSTEVPTLTTLLGKTQEEAIDLIARGATVVSTNPVEEEGNPIKTRVKLSLTDEPGDSRSGTPTVYLDLNAEGKIIQAGYSAATASLGYGSLSFSDAVKNEHIIENTLAEAGLAIPESSVELPADKELYSTYATDGTTLVNESYSFSGAFEQDGIIYEWSAVLRYDYTAANASGNLADTIRQVYVYVNDASVPIVTATAPAPEPEPSV